MNKTILLSKTLIMGLTITVLNCPMCFCKGESEHTVTISSCESESGSNNTYRNRKYIYMSQRSQTAPTISYRGNPEEKYSKNNKDIISYKFSNQRNRILKKALSNLWESMTCKNR